jgi:hypothetical protein
MLNYVEDIVYVNPVLDLQDLRNRITSAISTITPDTLQRIWIEIDCRMDVVRETNSAYMEIVQRKSRLH